MWKVRTQPTELIDQPPAKSHHVTCIRLKTPADEVGHHPLELIGTELREQGVGQWGQRTMHPGPVSELEEHLLNNVYFDTCVYHYPGIELLSKVIPVDNILFASEMIGAVRGIDPETGFHYDDTRRYIEAAALSAEDRHRIYEGNARRVYPRLDAALKAQGR